jgi:hypothetical protein
MINISFFSNAFLSQNCFSSSLSAPSSSSRLSPPSSTRSTSPQLFNDRSTNSGLAVGELIPDLLFRSRSLTTKMHSLQGHQNLQCHSEMLQLILNRGPPASLAFNGMHSGPDASIALPLLHFLQLYFLEYPRNK